MKKFNQNLLLIIFVLCLFALQFLYLEYRFLRAEEDMFETLYELGTQTQNLQDAVDELNQKTYAVERRSFVNIHKIPQPVVFCGDTLNYKDPVMRERIEREFFSMLDKQGQIQLYLKRSVKYFPMIESALRAAGLPNDLKYLAMHESALLPQIKSRSNAVGMWQFMRSSAHLYKLRIDRYVDERRDPQKATTAAMDMLRDLYQEFQDWPLVMAAYNGGLNRVKRSIAEQQSTSFFDLSLPEETERYYFKIVATKIIVSQAERFGFHISEDDFFQPTDVTSLILNISEGTRSLDKIAEEYKLSLVRFKDLNSHFTSAVLPAGSYTVYVPNPQYTRQEDQTNPPDDHAGVPD